MNGFPPSDMLLDIENVLSTAMILSSICIYWVVQTPRMPPASKTETKRRIPWIRTHVIFYGSVHASLMSLTAIRLVLSNSRLHPITLFDLICTPSALHASSNLSPGFLFGHLILNCGAILRFRSQRVLGKFSTWEISLKPGHKLCTTGPYSFVRHPSYLGSWAVMVGVDIIHSSSGTVLSDCIPLYPMIARVFLVWGYLITLALVVWMSYRAKWEDELMEREFGEVWRKWRE